MTRKKSECITVSGGEICVYTSTPSESSTKVAHHESLLIPGWGESAEAVLGFAEELSQLGNKIFTIDYEKLDSPHAELHCAIEPSFPATERVRSCAALEFLSQKLSDGETVNIIAHSQGAIAAMLCAVSRPDLVKNVILIAPAGVIRSSFFTLATRFVKSFFIQLTHALRVQNSAGKHYFSAVSRYITSNPIQMARDAAKIADIDIIPLIEKAKAQNINIHVVCNKDDRVFPIKKIEKCLTGLHSITALEGSHDEIFFHPKTFASHINKLLIDDE